MDLTLQFLGALGILVPFALLQAGRLSQHAYPYLAPNLAGAALLTADACLNGQWGFVMLQGVWALAAAVGIVRRARRGTSAGRNAPRPHRG